MIYHNEIFKPVHRGDRLRGYVTHIRADEKVDVALHQGVDPLSQEILAVLQERGGFIPLSDKSDAEEIASTFGCSKKNFKKAIGALYKKRIIIILDEGIRLAE